MGRILLCWTSSVYRNSTSFTAHYYSAVINSCLQTYGLDHYFFVSRGIIFSAVDFKTSPRDKKVVELQLWELK